MKKFVLLLCLFSGLCSSAFTNTLYKSGVVASFYAEDFHGKKTSNGEIFNMWAMTCAHKMLPFNTVLKVTNLSNGKSVEVRVNDRGPFVGTREIDLSKGAASKLGMIGSGTAKVRLEIVKLGAYTKQSVITGQKACKKAGIKYVQIKVNENSSGSEPGLNNTENERIAKIKSIKRDAGKLWDIQIGAFSQRENAYSFAQKVKKAGFKNVILQKTTTVIRVSLKAVNSEDVNKTVDLLAAKGFKDLVVRERKQ